MDDVRCEVRGKKAGRSLAARNGVQLKLAVSRGGVSGSVEERVLGSRG